MQVEKQYLTIPVFLLFGLLFARADETSRTSNVPTKKQAQALEATASTPQEHLKLANYYRDQARKLDEKVRHNEEMADVYRRRPFPLDGKMGVPMRHLCQDWASQFAEQEQRAIGLANFHAAKAGKTEAVANPLARFDSFGLLRPSFMDREGGRVRTTPEQSSSFSNWIDTSKHFYDLTRISSYVLNAKGQQPVELVQVQTSAAALFDAQQRFLEALTGTQRMVLSPHLTTLEKLRRNIENQLNRLATVKALPASASYFKIVSGLKRDVEGWTVQQRGIADELGIQSQQSFSMKSDTTQ